LVKLTTTSTIREASWKKITLVMGVDCYGNFCNLITMTMDSNLERLMSIFESMNKDGINTSSKLKWGFFFNDKNRGKLLRVFEELKGAGYELDQLRRVEGENEWQLEVSKFDILTPEKLHKRNIAFNELAEYCSVALYDGWDVEKV